MRASASGTHDDAPRLSVCCMTHDDPVRVARSLEPFLELDCEFVLALDEQVPVADLGPLARLSSHLYRFAFREPVDRVRPWLLSRCRGTWILVIDGDEVVSPALHKKLPELLDDDDVETYAISRRWTFPDLGHWLHEAPWWPDFQVRLVRNRPDTALVQGILPHQGLPLVMPARYVLEPLYHVDPVTTPFADRAAKAASYERQRPGLTAPSGGPLNHVFYLPEHHVRRRPVPVPVDDLDRLAEVWGDSGPDVDEDGAETSPVAALRLTLIPERELAVHQPPWGAATDGCTLELRVLEQDLRFAPGETRGVVVVVENTGATVVPGGSRAPHEFFLSYHLRAASGAVVDHEGQRTRLPAPVMPGDQAVVEVRVRAPERAGRYLVSFDAVHELVRWFRLATGETEILVAPRFAG